MTLNQPRLPVQALQAEINALKIQKTGESLARKNSMAQARLLFRVFLVSCHGIFLNVKWSGSIPCETLPVKAVTPSDSEATAAPLLAFIQGHAVYT